MTLMSALADEMARTAVLHGGINLGTNDLTQPALGMSRDDSGSFLRGCAESEIVKQNPFATIGQTGVGQLMQVVNVEKRKAAAPKVKKK